MKVTVKDVKEYATKDMGDDGLVRDAQALVVTIFVLLTPEEEKSDAVQRGVEVIKNTLNHDINFQSAQSLAGQTDDLKGEIAKMKKTLLLLERENGILRQQKGWKT